MFARATFRDTARVIAPPISANISANLAQILMPACGLAVIYMLRPHLDIPCAPTYRTPTFLKNYAPTVSCPQPASYTSIINSLSMLIIYVRRYVATDPFLLAALIVTCTPTANNIVVMCAVSGENKRAMVRDRAEIARRSRLDRAEIAPRSRRDRAEIAPRYRAEIAMRSR